MTATLPESAARRFSRFSLSYSLVACSAWAVIAAMRASTSMGFPAPSMMVVSSLRTITRRALPTTSRSTFSNVMPRSSVITCAPVSVAMSFRTSLRRSPKAGALTATVLKTPFKRLRIRVPRASPSTSSAIKTRSFLPAWASFSSNGKNSWMLEIFLSVTTMAVLS